MINLFLYPRKDGKYNLIETYRYSVITTGVKDREENVRQAVKAIANKYDEKDIQDKINEIDGRIKHDLVPEDTQDIREAYYKEKLKEDDLEYQSIIENILEVNSFFVA